MLESLWGSGDTWIKRYRSPKFDVHQIAPYFLLMSVGLKWAQKCTQAATRSCQGIIWVLCKRNKQKLIAVKLFDCLKSNF